MTDEKLKRANDLRACLDVLKEFKEIFETKPQLSINQVGTSRLTDDILIPWKELNIEFIKETNDFQIDRKDFDKKLDKHVKVVSFSHVSNVT